MGKLARTVTVIETDDLRGRGTTRDPFRRVMQYWTLDGTLLAESDPATCGNCLRLKERVDAMAEGIAKVVRVIQGKA